MTEIGRLFYENPNGDHKAELELCADIDDRKRRIASMQGDLSSLKGVRICGKCGARFDEKYTFWFLRQLRRKAELKETMKQKKRHSLLQDVLFLCEEWKIKWKQCFLFDWKSVSVNSAEVIALMRKHRNEKLDVLFHYADGLYRVGVNPENAREPFLHG